MEYKEFSRASLRHFHTCQLLYEKLIELPQSEMKKKQFLIHNIYYLSGYVFETLLSYAFFSKLRWDGKIEESCHFQDKKFKTHNLSSKIIYAKQYNCDLSGIFFLDRRHSNKILQKMFDNWCVDLRYQETSTLKGFRFCEEDIRQYIDEIRKVQEIILKRFIS